MKRNLWNILRIFLKRTTLRINLSQHCKTGGIKLANFIKVHDHIINVESISKVKCLHDDISLEYFPTDEKGEVS